MVSDRYLWYSPTGVQMNLTETTRHAVAITEQVIQTALVESPGRNFHVKPITDIVVGTGFDGSYRIFELEVSSDGEVEAVVEVILVRSLRSSEWRWAIAECHIIGWVSGTYNYRAANNMGTWQVRKACRIAYGHEGQEVLEWDAKWCDSLSRRSRRVVDGRNCLDPHHNDPLDERGCPTCGSISNALA